MKPACSPVLAAFRDALPSPTPARMKEIMASFPTDYDLDEDSPAEILAVENRRAVLAVDWILRTHAPAWLAEAGVEAESARLANLPPLLDAWHSATADVKPHAEAVASACCAVSQALTYVGNEHHADRHKAIARRYADKMTTSPACAAATKLWSEDLRRITFVATKAAFGAVEFVVLYYVSVLCLDAEDAVPSLNIVADRLAASEIDLYKRMASITTKSLRADPAR